MDDNNVVHCSEAKYSKWLIYWGIFQRLLIADHWKNRHFLESSTQQHIVIWIAIYFVWVLQSSIFISICVHYFNPFSNHLILASLIFIFSYISIKNREQKRCFQQLTMSVSKMAFWCAVFSVHRGNFLAHPNGIAILSSSAHIYLSFIHFFYS